MATLLELKEALEMAQVMTLDLTRKTRALREHPVGLDRRVENLTRRLGECIMLSRELEVTIDEAIKERQADWMPDLS
jgi:hypothetical protein